ncbi:dihydrofolate reductase [bacterium]|nr:dihydrofolate reductase [bacterium]
MKIIAIAAVGRNGVIGRSGQLPWDLPEDMRFFRDSTRGQVVVMGRKTYESLGKALPKRENAILTRDPSWKAPDARVFRSIEDAIGHYRRHQEFQDCDLFVIGGGEIYALSLPSLDEIWLTEIDSEFEGDAFFPGYGSGELSVPGFSRAESRLQREEPASGLRYVFSRFVRNEAFFQGD